MAEDASAWKQRYELALEAIERTARDNREFTQELVRALNRLTLACEGQDAELDMELRELRAFLRLKTLSREVLASKVDVLEDRLRDSARRERTVDTRLKNAITTLLDQVDTSKPPRETQRAAQLLRKELRALDPLDALVKAVALRSITLPAPADAAQTTSGGLLQKLFGTKGNEERPTPPPVAEGAAPLSESPSASQHLPEASAADTALAETPDPAEFPIDDSCRKILVELVDALQPAETEARQHAAFVSIRERLARSVRIRELAAVLEEVLLLSRGALEQNRREFSVFLEELSSRLVNAAETIAEGGNLDARRQDNSNSLDAAMRDGLEHIRHEMSDARDLQALKQEVNTRLEGISRAFESFREQEERIGTESASGARALAERVIELQEKTRAAEAMIEEQRRLAHTDTLTRLPNREAWSVRLQQEFQRWQRYRRPLSLAVCDIDRFKTVNDRFGHSVGDAVLRAVGECVSSQMRKTDFVARFGGEEFVFLLPETTPEQARGAMEKVREAVAALLIDAGERKGIKVTASFGLAGFSGDDEPDRVFTRADTALYQAKAAGRDCVVNYSSAPG